MRKKILLDTDLEENLVNLTPLIDVLFVVLISFILIAPMLKIDSISLTETTQELPTLSKKHPIRISLLKDGTILVNNQRTNLGMLDKMLRDTEDKSIPPQVFPDKEVAFEHYQKIKDTIQSSGYQELDVILEPK